MAENLPASEAGKVVDVSGLYVTPGLIDIHFHVGHGGAPLNWFAPEANAQTAPLGIPADFALTAGVTTLVDAGTAGADTFLQEKQEVIDHAKVRVLAFLNIVADGMEGGTEQDVSRMDVQFCAQTVQKFPDIIVGVKTAHYWTDEALGRRTYPVGRGGPGRGMRPVSRCPGHGGFLAPPGADLRRPDPEEDAAGGYSHARVRAAISHPAP